MTQLLHWQCLRMAQLGRALAWGARGRWFKSSYADQFSVGPC